MDLESVLAKFAASGSIVSRHELDMALEELMESIATSHDDVPSLLGTLANSSPGMLEVVLTSRSHSAFTFRSRITKALQKSLATSGPILRTCASRLGLFLINAPASVAPDRNVMEDYNALASTASSEDSVELSHSFAEETPSEPKFPDKSVKRDRRRAGAKSPVQAKKAILKSESAAKLLASLDPSTGDDNALSNRPKLLVRFIENFFTSCINEDIEEFAISSLLGILTTDNTPTPLNVTPSPSTRQNKTSPSIDAPFSSAPSNVAASSQPLHYLQLKPGDIAALLNRTPKPKSGDWPVVISQRGVKRLREFLPDRNDIFLRIEKKIRQLSVGFFPKINQTKLLERDFGIPIYTADLGDDFQLIYQIDFGAATSTEDESQFIRVFGIFSQSEIDMKFWVAVAAQLGRRGQGYIGRCTAREETRIRFKGIETTPPMLGSPFSISQWYEDGADIQIDEEQFLELHRVIALEKYTPLSRTFFEAIQRFDEHSFMFQPSSAECQVIHHPSSCLVLGRSGTGKTTCMLLRMLILEKASQESGRPLRQVFLSRSRMLVYRVQQYWKRLQQNEDNTDHNGVRKSFSLLDLDDHAEGEDGLPQRFSQLDDSHFPLFLTFDQLCKLLETDYDLQFIPSTENSLATFRAKRRGKPIRNPFVSFEFFLSDIWPRLDERAKTGLHPANVFGEFMGVIKGSEASFNRGKRQLSRQEYESQSARSHADNQSTRSRVYTLFEAYMKKRPPYSYDMADRVYALMEEIQQNGVPGGGIDFLYVDEAQDHLMLDAALLRSLCRNPHGLFLAGDTAQTISLGSTFRFKELKGFLYRLERGDLLVKQGARKPVDPHFFQLSVNYRSHSGIVKAAAFLVHLISSYFSYSIDLLKPEASLVDVCAQKPIFMLGQWSQDNFLELFPGSARGGVRLGPDQGKQTVALCLDEPAYFLEPAIIVRNDTTAKRLQEVVGDIPGLLTLYESKGLEYDDVILYDFFADSDATNTDWRAILHSQSRGTPFDERKHSILRRELKSLYVGLTRARERVWIWDRSTNGTEFEELLVSLDLATSCQMVDPILFRVTSSSEEWSQRGQQYFSKTLYSKARACFRNAGMPWWEDVCEAYNDRQTALRLPQGDQGRIGIFLRAAKEFERLALSSQGSATPTTRCLLFTNAGECYAASSDYTTAACAFIEAQKYTEAAYHYRLSGQLEEAIQLIRKYPVDQVVKESIIDEAKFDFTRKGDLPSLRKAWDLCGSRNDFFDFLRNNGFDDQRVTVHDYLKEYEESGDILWDRGKYLPAINRLRRANTASSWRKAKECLLEGLRAIVSFANGYNKQSRVLSGLFELRVDAKLSQDEMDEVELLRDIANSASEPLEERYRQYRSTGNKVHALFAFDALIWSGALRSVQTSSETEALKVLGMCQTYHSLVKDVVGMQAILDKQSARHSFGVLITKSGDGIQEETISVKYPSFVQTALPGSALVSINATKGIFSVRLSKVELADQLRGALLVRLHNVISEVDSLARKSRAFQLSMNWKAYPRNPDLESTTRAFNSQFRLHILMISLLNRTTVVGKAAETRLGKQRVWLLRLFKLCYPTTNKCGNLLDIKPSLIPEYRQAISVVKSCLRETFSGLRPSKNPKDFLDNVLITSLLATTFDYTAAASYLDFKKQDFHQKWLRETKKKEKERDTLFAKEYRLLFPGTDDSLAEEVLTWCAQKNTDSTGAAVRFLMNVLAGDVWLDIEVVIAFIEDVCGQLVFNYKMHRANDSYPLLIPRSWMMRALSRGPSSLPNGNTLKNLVASLEGFIRILSLKGHSDGCRLHIEGASLNDVKLLARRNQTWIQACRCLALVGHNIAGLRGRVLTIFNEMDNCPFLGAALEDQSDKASLAWDNVLEALKSASSDRDDLLVIHRKDGIAHNVPGSKRVFSFNEGPRANQLSLLPGASALSSYISALWGQPSSQPVPALPELQIVLAGRNFGKQEPSHHTAGGKSPDNIQRLNKSAKTIQSFFCLHHSPAGGTVVTALENTIKLRIQMEEACADDRYIVFCLRGLLLHVAAYLERLRGSADSRFTDFEKRYGCQEGEHLDESDLSEGALKLREIRDNAGKLLDELKPTSEFHFDGTPNSPASLSEVLNKIQTIPGLVESLRLFATLPNDTLPDPDKIDGKLRVDPVLKCLAPWSPTEST